MLVEGGSQRGDRQRTQPGGPSTGPPSLLDSHQDHTTPRSRRVLVRRADGRGPSLPSPPTACSLSPGSQGEVQTPVLALAGRGVGPHLPQEGQVPGEGALIQRVVFREEGPWALGREASQRVRFRRARRHGEGGVGKGSGIDSWGAGSCHTSGTVLGGMPALGRLCTAHEPPGPHPSHPGHHPGLAPPPGGLSQEASWGAPLRPLAQEVLCFPEPPHFLPLTQAGDSGMDPGEPAAK